MKRLLKHEWKCYLAAILLTSIFMLGYQFDNIFEGNYLEKIISSYNDGAQSDFEQNDIGEYGIDNIYFPITGFVDSVSYGLLNIANDQWNIVILGIALLIIKFFQYWNEKSVYGREFIVMLPVKKRTRKGFYVLADSIFVAASMLIYTVGALVYVIYGLRRYEIEIPWLTKAVIGEMLTSISYMLMLLGIIEFLEILFVDGIMKIVGGVSMLGMSAFVLQKGFDAFYKVQFVQKLYGFLTLKGAGKQYFEEDTINFFSIGEWRHSITDPPILFQGQSLGELPYEKWGFNLSFDEEFSRIYDFTHISTYAGWVVCYLIIGCIMAGIAIWLAGKSDVSQHGFYFGFGRVLFSIFVGAAFFAMCIGAVKVIWHKLLVVGAAIVIIVVLIYLMDPNRKRLFGREV